MSDKKYIVAVAAVQEPLRQVFTYLTPAKLIFGVDAVNRVGTEAKTLKASRPLIVTDKGVEKAGLAEKVKLLLEQEGMPVAVFSDLEAEPTTRTAEPAVEFAHKGEYDLVVGVGGGSSMDLAKIVAAMVTNPGPIKKYMGVNQVVNPTLPKILIPTTAGTGAEASHAAMITDSETHDKAWVMDPKMFPNVAIVDPMLTIGLPPRATAGTGLDALSHSIEGLMSLGSNPLTKFLSYGALRLIAQNLRKAYYQGSNLEARCGMALAATVAMSAMANTGATLAHAVSYVLSAHYGTPHGEGCGVALPYVMDYNMPTCEEEFKRIAETMGEDTANLTTRQGAIKAVNAVQSLVKEIDIPFRLADMNVPKTDIPILAEECRTRHRRPTNPRRVEEQSFLRMFERMWEGSVSRIP